MSEEYVLEMHDIVKEFPGVRALKGVQLKVRPGTVHNADGGKRSGEIHSDEMSDRHPSGDIGKDYI